MGEHRVCCYLICPQADEWLPVVGFVPDHDTYHEVGFMVTDPQEGRSVVLVRFLIGRDEDSPFVFADWYPKEDDPRKRPDYNDIREIEAPR